MIDVKGQLKGVTDRGTWAARRTSFVAKVKATKMVWFPPEPAETGKKAASTAKKTTKRAAKKTTGTAKRTTGAAKKTTAAAKTTSGTKKVTTPVRRKNS
jgi:hypothetical protein